MADAVLTLFDPRNGDLALRVADLGDDLTRPQRTNYFTLVWVQEGGGTFWADLAQHTFQAAAVLCFVPYQGLRFQPETPVRGLVLQFHANFFCIEAHHAEVGCNGVLFNPNGQQDLGEKKLAQLAPLLNLIHNFVENKDEKKQEDVIKTSNNPSGSSGGSATCANTTSM